MSNVGQTHNAGFEQTNQARSSKNKVQERIRCGKEWSPAFFRGNWREERRMQGMKWWIAMVRHKCTGKYDVQRCKNAHTIVSQNVVEVNIRWFAVYSAFHSDCGLHNAQKKRTLDYENSWLRLPYLVWWILLLDKGHGASLILEMLIVCERVEKHRRNIISDSLSLHSHCDRGTRFPHMCMDSVFSSVATARLVAYKFNTLQTAMSSVGHVCWLHWWRGERARLAHGICQVMCACVHLLRLVISYSQFSCKKTYNFAKTI